MTELLTAEIQKSPEQTAQQELDNFVQNPGLDDLAKLYGVAELPADKRERLSILQKVAAEHWDFRKGAERQDVNWGEDKLAEEGSGQWNVVFDAADKLGMIQSGKLKNTRPKYLVILGGANKAPHDRLKFGQQSAEDYEHVVYLGSSRKVSDGEREKAVDYAPNAQTEFDLGSGAIVKELGARLVSEDKTIRNGDVWAWREYEHEQEDGETKTDFALSTPQEIHESSDPDKKHRATTYDNYKFFVGRAELADDPDATVAAITTGFYVPAQHLVAVQELTLRYGTPVETIGHSAEYSGATRLPKPLLQEVKAAIDAAVRLQNAIDQKV